MSDICCACGETWLGDIRQWQCGCFGHKDCFKDGAHCKEHDVHPFTQPAPMPKGDQYGGEPV